MASGYHPALEYDGPEGRDREEIRAAWLVMFLETLQNANFNRDAVKSESAIGWVTHPFSRAGSELLIRRGMKVGED